MTRRWRLARGVLAFAVVLGVLGVSAVDDATANPEVCGFVRYSTDNTDPDETVPYVPYCEWPCFPGVSVPPGHHGTIAWEAFVCVRGL